MNRTKTLPREPWRGSMICGEQISSGMPGGRFCAERKAEDLPVCAAHWEELTELGESLRFAPGNALGAPQWAVRLLWEGEDPDVPIEASADEVAAYAAILA